MKNLKINCLTPNSPQLFRHLAENQETKQNEIIDNCIPLREESYLGNMDKNGNNQFWKILEYIGQVK